MANAYGRHDIPDESWAEIELLLSCLGRETLSCAGKGCNVSRKYLHSSKIGCNELPGVLCTGAVH